MSFAPILVRQATGAGASSLAVAMWRNALAVGLLAPVLAVGVAPASGDVPGPRRTGAWMMAAGLALAVHFAAWTASVGRTTVANASTIVSATPAVTLVIGWLVLGERLTRRSGVIIGLAVLGAAIVGGADLAGATERLDGNALAALGAVAGAVYLVIGRRVRATRSLLAYVTPVFAVCAVVLGAARLATGDGLGLPLGALGWVALLVLSGQLAGHVVANLLLAHLPAWAVAVTAASEAVGASVLAWWLLDEPPTAGFWVGGPLLLAAVVASATRASPAADERPGG